jgi:DNA ligase (NAD+)
VSKKTSFVVVGDNPGSVRAPAVARGADPDEDGLRVLLAAGQEAARAVAVTPPGDRSEVSKMFPPRVVR